MSTTAQSANLTAEDIDRFGRDPLALFSRNLAAVEERIVRACGRAGRARETVRLLPITKTVPARVLRYAHAAGIRDFGENKIQEAVAKQAELADLDIAWSIVGHLQTNKVKYVARFAREFHALDSLRLAETLDARLDREGRSLDVYVQVNTSDEESKYGLRPDQLLPYLGELKRFPRLKPRGLMTLAVFSTDLDKVRPCFERLHELRDAAVRDHPAIAELSMGMSNDFEEAIQQGADVVRVGEAIFGKRSTPDGHYWPTARTGE